MKLIVKNNGEILELEGTIRCSKSQFYAEICVSDEIKLNPIIINIKGEYNFRGKVTLVNNKNTYIRTSESNPSESIYVYEAGYMISGFVDEESILISGFSIYFKELDSFFVKDGYSINVEKLETEFTITQKFYSEILLENDYFSIEYNKAGGIEHDLSGHTLFVNPSKLNLIYKEAIPLTQVFEEMSKIEKVLGFTLNKKMNLLETKVFEKDGDIHDLIVQYQKDYEEVEFEELHIVDLNSKQLLKDILTKYYTDDRIAATINMFYEYIYNNLDTIFEFTSLVNTLEMILTDSKHYRDIIKYTLENSEELKQNNIKMKDILNKLDKEEQIFIKQFYRFENVQLRNKIEYIFYEKFKLSQNENSEKLISKIVKTRNYYVHGGKRDNILNNVEMVITKCMLKDILYILISDICSSERNSLIDTYYLSIPVVYNSIINNSK